MTLVRIAAVTGVVRSMFLTGLALCAAAPARTATEEIPLFSAVFGVEWHGITAGYSTLTLKSTGLDTYLYSSTIKARGIFVIAFPDAIGQQSTFRVIDGHVAPLTYQEDNGPKKRADDVKLEFDWDAKQVRGMAGSKKVEQPLETGTLDPLSVQIELMKDLVAGEPPKSFLLFDKHEATRYDYTRERTETLQTDLGRLETVVYRSDRPGSNRVTHLWLAPSLGYIPVRGERWSKGSIDFSLTIRKLTRGTATPSAPAPPPATSP